MKKNRSFGRRLSASLGQALIFSSLYLCASAVNLFAQDWKTVADGVEHAQVRREFSGKNADINLLRLDLKKVRLDVHHALDKAIGLETTSSIARRKGAIAAINAGFFRLDKSIWAGDSAGILQVDGKLLSESNGMRIELLLGNGPQRTEVFLARLGIEQQIELGNEIFQAVGLNRERRESDLVIYTPEFDRSTLTNSMGVECVVLRSRIVNVRDRLGNSQIPIGGFVISASGNFRERVLKLVRKNMLVSLPTLGNAIPNSVYLALLKDKKNWDITNGVPQLIKNGKIDITWEQEQASKSFVETRHPRTAVAKLKDGKFLMLTADGRSEASAGVDLYDLAKYMLDFGAVDAMNLDGGGSTTMFLDGKVVNKPSDKEGERKIGDAIVVTLRKPKKRP